MKYPYGILPTIAILVTILSVFSCKKKESASPDSTTSPITVTPDSESVSGSLTTITYTKTLTKDSYEATLGDMAVTVINSGDSALIFALPFGIDVGVLTLKVPELNFEYHIQVNKPSPISGVDEQYQALLSLFAAITDQFKTLSSGTQPAGHDQLNNLLSQLSSSDKERVVRYVQLMNRSTIPQATARNPSRLKTSLKNIRSMGTAANVSPENDMTVSSWIYNFSNASVELDYYAYYALLAPTDSPEKLITTYLGWLYGQIADFYLTLVLSRPVILDEVYIAASPLMELPPPSVATDPDRFPVYKAGVPFPLHAAVTMRSIAMNDRPATTDEDTSELLAVLFDASKMTASAIHSVNRAMHSLVKAGMLEGVPELAITQIPQQTAAENYLFSSMPVDWIANHLNLHDGEARFTLTGKESTAGMAQITMGYAGDFRAAYRQVYSTNVQFKLTDEFNQYSKRVPIKIQAPDPERIVIEAENNTPMRFTLPYGRLNLKLQARVLPAEAPQDVVWSITEGYKLAVIGQDGSMMSTFKSTNDSTGYGYSKVRARFKEDPTVFSEVDVKTTSYKIKYVSGANQTFTGGIPYPIQVSVEDRLDGSCLFNPTAPRQDNVEEKLRLAGFAVDTRFTNGNDFQYVTSGPSIPQMCALSLSFSVPRRGVDPYKLPIWVYLYQDEHIIDRLAIYVNINDYKP